MNTQTSLNAAAAPGRRTVLNNRYTLTRRIATGGMAEIFLARQRAQESGFEKDVVVKYLREVYRKDPRVQEMFRDEATIGAFLNHPNVVHSYEFGNHESMPYIAMEYIRGEELQLLCRRGVEAGRFLPLEHAVDLMRQAAEGMGHFHGKRGDDGALLDIVHRDISPSNLLVTVDGVLKIIDFGIARMRGLPGKANDADKLVPGKYNYMAPEQVRGEACDHRSDIFSLGIVLYEITVGKRLFKGRPEEVIQKITRARIKPPTFVRRQFPAGLEQIVMKCLEMHPEDRYDTAVDLASDLEEFLRDARLKSGPVRIAQYLDELRVAEAETRRPELLMAGESWGDHEDGGEEPIDLDRTFLPETPPEPVVLAPLPAPRETVPAPSPSRIGRGTGPETPITDAPVTASEVVDALRDAFADANTLKIPAPASPEGEPTKRTTIEELGIDLSDEPQEDEILKAVSARPMWDRASRTLGTAKAERDADGEEQTDVLAFAGTPSTRNEIKVVHAVPAAEAAPAPEAVDSKRTTLPGVVAPAPTPAPVAAQPVKLTPPPPVRRTPPPPPLRMTPPPAAGGMLFTEIADAPPPPLPDSLDLRQTTRKARKSSPPVVARPEHTPDPAPAPAAVHLFPAPSPLTEVPASAPPGTAEAMAEVARLLEARRAAALASARAEATARAAALEPVAAPAEKVEKKAEKAEAPAPVVVETPVDVAAETPPRPRLPRRKSRAHKAPKLNFAAAAERVLGETSAASPPVSLATAATAAFGGHLVDKPKSFPWILVLIGVGILAMLGLIVF